MISDDMNVEYVVNVDEEGLSQGLILSQQGNGHEREFLNQILEI